MRSDYWRPGDRRAVLFALVGLAVVRAALWSLPFRIVERAIVRVAQRLAGSPTAGLLEDDQAVTRAILRATRIHRRALCLSQALVGLLLAARRNVRARVRIGVRAGASEAFGAHAWLETDRGVPVGGAEAARFAPLVTLDPFTSRRDERRMPADIETVPLAQHDRLLAWELCLACGRHAAGIAAPGEVTMAAARIENWDVALALLSEQSLVAWLARAQPDAPHGGMPERVRAAAGDEARATLARVRQLTDVCAALSAAGVVPLPYKGPALSLQLYGELGLRRSIDLDVVVPHAAYPRAREALVRMGLAPRGGHSARQERALFTWLGQASFGTGASDFVELHWRFAPAQFPFALTPEAAIARSTSTMVAGRELRLMARDDLLVTLAMHGARHFYERLEWLAGVARLVREFPDARAIAGYAQGLRARRTLLVSAEVAHQVLDLALDASWRHEIDGDAEVVPLAIELTEMIRAHGYHGASYPVGAQEQALYARLMDTRADRLRSLMRALFLPTAREWELVPLPDALTPLYRVIRPVRVAARYARRLYS